MYLFVDGARLGYGLGADGNDLTLADFGRLADVFYIGGTKCGAFFGEALVLTDAGIDRRSTGIPIAALSVRRRWCGGGIPSAG